MITEMTSTTTTTPAESKAAATSEPSRSCSVSSSSSSVSTVVNEIIQSLIQYAATVDVNDLDDDLDDDDTDTDKEHEPYHQGFSSSSSSSSVQQQPQPQPSYGTAATTTTPTGATTTTTSSPRNILIQSLLQQRLLQQNVAVVENSYTEIRPRDDGTNILPTTTTTTIPTTILIHILLSYTKQIRPHCLVVDSDVADTNQQQHQQQQSQRRQQRRRILQLYEQLISTTYLHWNSNITTTNNNNNNKSSNHSNIPTTTTTCTTATTEENHPRNATATDTAELVPLAVVSELVHQVLAPMLQDVCHVTINNIDITEEERIVQQLLLLRCIRHTLNIITIVVTTATNTTTTTTTTTTNATTATLASVFRSSLCLWLGYTNSITSTTATTTTATEVAQQEQPEPGVSSTAAASPITTAATTTTLQPPPPPSLTSYLFPQQTKNYYFYQCPSLSFPLPTIGGDDGDDDDGIIMSHLIHTNSSGDDRNSYQQDYLFRRRTTKNGHNGCDDEGRNSVRRRRRRQQHQMLLQQQIWEQLYQLIVINGTSGGGGCGSSSTTTYHNNDATDPTTMETVMKPAPNSLSELQDCIIQSLQYDKLVQCLHSYYFLQVVSQSKNHSDTLSSSSSSHQQQLTLHLGRFVSSATQSSNATTATNNNNNKNITSTTGITNYDAIFHRDHCIHTLIQLVLYLNSTTAIAIINIDIDRTTVKTVMEDMFPMLYTLLNSTKQKEVRIGTILVYNVLSYLLQKQQQQEMTITANRAQQQRMNTTGTTRTMISPQILDNLQIILQHLIKINRVGSTLWMIGYAQRILFQLRYTQQQQQQHLHEIKHSGSRNDDVYTDSNVVEVTAYKSIQEWLNIIDRNNRHYTQDHLIVGLVMGIVPMLFDQASNIVYDNRKRTAILPYGVEIGRLGLSSFLPILDGESGYDEVFHHYNRNATSPNIYDESSTTDDPIFLDSDGGATTPAADDYDPTTLLSIRISGMVQLATLAALSNLFIVAYPIMYRHSGKILCTLIAFIRRLQDVITSSEKPTGMTTPDIASTTTKFSTTERKSVLQTLSRLRESILERALYVAAMATVAGNESATALLNKIVDGGRYDTAIIDIVHSILLKATAVIEKETRSKQKGYIPYK